MMAEMLCLLAHVGGSGVLFDADTVESVVDIGEITPAPGAAPAVRGLAALRSRVVTVIDTWQLLDLAPPDGVRSRAVVAQIDGQYYAVLVDSLEDVAGFAVAPLAAGLALGPRWSAIAIGAAERDGEPLLVIDLARMIAGVGGQA